MSLLIRTFIIFLVVVGCKVDKAKEETRETTTVKTADSSLISVVPVKWNDFMERQVFEFNPIEQSVIEGRLETNITIPANCFDGKDSVLQLEIIECYSIYTILTNRVTTNTRSNAILETGGMVYLNVTNEDGVSKQPRFPIEIKVPNTTKMQNAEVFLGERSDQGVQWEDTPSIKLHQQAFIKDETDAFQGDEKKILKQNKGNRQVGNKNPEIEINGKTYKVKDKQLVNYAFMTASLGWLNVDQFREFSTADLLLSVGPGYRKASYFVVLKNYNSVFYNGVGKSANDQGQVVFPKIPDSEPFTVIGFGAKEGELYFHMEDYEANPGSIDFPALEPITQQEMSQKLLEKFGKDIWSRPAA